MKDGRPATSLVLGVLGGIASGKSQVARLLAGSGGVVMDADAIARDVLASPEVVTAIRAAFGPEVMDSDGRPDRGRLAARVFADPALRTRLESFTHPRIRARIRALLDEARAHAVPRIVLDVPLLLENDAQHGLVRECDALVFVDADAHSREERARASRGWPAGEVARREAIQMPLASKRSRADHVVMNRRREADLEHEVARVLEAIERTRRTP